MIPSRSCPALRRLSKLSYCSEVNYIPDEPVFEEKYENRVSPLRRTAPLVLCLRSPEEKDDIEKEGRDYSIPLRCQTVMVLNSIAVFHPVLSCFSAGACTACQNSLRRDSSLEFSSVVVVPLLRGQEGGVRVAAKEVKAIDVAGPSLPFLLALHQTSTFFL